VADGVAAVVVVFDYSGIGESTGSVEEISRAEHLADMIAVYDWALSLDSVDSKKVGVNGGSYSGYMATLLTAHRPVASLLLRAPAVFPDESFYIPGDTDAPRQERYFEQIVEGSTADMLTKALRKYTNPLLVQEREGDAIITPPIIDYFLGANNSTLQKHTVLKNAGHKISGESKQVSTKECIDWFKQTL
jgi:hypothetical protein